MKKSKRLHCRGKYNPQRLLNGDYCAGCLRLGFVPLRGARKCLIPGCVNRTDQGQFIGDMCAPCHCYVVNNRGTHSQAYRNEVVKANIRVISQFFATTESDAVVTKILRS